MPACKKVKQVTQNDVDIAYIQSVTVPSASVDSSMPFPGGGLWVPFPLVALATQHEEKLHGYNIESDKVTFAGLDVLTFRFSQNFNFLDSAQVFLSAANLPEQFIGYINAVPQGQALLDLKTMSGLNIKDYFLKDTVYFRLLWHTNALPPTGTSFEMGTSFRVLAGGV